MSLYEETITKLIEIVSPYRKVLERLIHEKKGLLKLGRRTNENEAKKKKYKVKKVRNQVQLFQ